MSTAFAISGPSSSEQYLVRVLAETSNGSEQHFLFLDADKGYGYTDIINTRYIRRADIPGDFGKMIVKCVYTASQERQSRWLSEKFTKQQPLRKPFDRPSGLICFVPDKNTVRVAVDPPAYGERVLNVDMPANKYSDNREGIKPLFNTYGGYVSVERAAIIDQPVRMQSCRFKVDDTLGVDYELIDITEKSSYEQPLERITEIWCIQNYLYRNQIDTSDQ